MKMQPQAFASHGSNKLHFVLTDHFINEIEIGIAVMLCE